MQEVEVKAKEIEIPFLKTYMQILTCQLEKFEKGEISISDLNATSKAVEQANNMACNYIKKVDLEHRIRMDSYRLSLNNRKPHNEPQKFNSRSRIHDIKQMINQFLQSRNNLPHNIMPNQNQLHDGGPSYDVLIDIILAEGGFEVVAGKLGLQWNGNKLEYDEILEK